MHNTAISNLNRKALMFKPLIAGFCAFLFLAGADRPQPQTQAVQDAGQCESIFVAAENRARSEDPNAPKEALMLYQQALGCTSSTENHRRAQILAGISKMQLLLGKFKEAIA